MEYLVPEHLDEVKIHKETPVQKTMRVVKEQLARNHRNKCIRDIEQARTVWKSVSTKLTQHGFFVEKDYDNI